MRGPSIRPVVLSGGAGTRLWPVSRALYPKQLLPMVGEYSLLQETLRRLSNLPGAIAPAVICNNEHRFAVAEQLQAMGLESASVVLEPVGRNSCPAAVTAALLTAREDPEAVVLMLASDHVVENVEGLHSAIAVAARAAALGRIVSIAIEPTRPETGYGYIRKGEPIEEAPGAFAVERFVEKPDLATAEAYLADGGYVWNSSMFAFRADVLLAEAEALAPDVLAACRSALQAAQTDLDFLRLDATAFEAAPSISFDYAVMEKTDKAAVVPADLGWSDVGAWSAVRDARPKDDQGNATQGDVLLHDVTDSLVRSDSRLVTVVGLDRVVVVETPDAVLVSSADRAQDVKNIVDRLKADGRPEATIHARVHRPWGDYEGLDIGDGFQVKRITVKPGAALSLQRHAKRAEHWVVISGRARVTRGPDMERLDVVHLETDQSIDIPLGWIHRLENPATEPLVIIEVQTGDYLGEDDIERLEDVYGRG